MKTFITHRFLFLSILTLSCLISSFSTVNAQCPIMSNGTYNLPTSALSWGQSFVPTCSSNARYMTFNTATAINSGFTFTLRNGIDCSGTTLYTQQLAKIIDGENRVTFQSPIPLVAGNTYYFSVESNTTSTFQVRCGSSSPLTGNLKTHKTFSPKTACDQDLATYDWNFTVDTTNYVKPTVFPNLSTKNVDLFVLAGQSNAQGWQGDGAFYPTDPLKLDPTIGLYYAYVDSYSSMGNWITLQPQSGRFSKGHFGAEVTFSRKLKENGFNPIIFKYTKGSTAISWFWKKPGTGGAYDNMIVELKKAISVLVQKGYAVNIRGFVWIQGESDATTNDSPPFYASLLSIVRDFRTNVAKNNTLPVLLGVDEQHPAVVNFPIIVESQKRIANEEANVKFTSMIGLTKADATHLSPGGLVAHGIRLFDDYKTLNLTSEIPNLKKLNYELIVNNKRLIVSSQDFPLKLSVYNLAGQLISTQSSSQGRIDIPLAIGCYLVKINTEYHQHIEKLIVS